MQLDSTHWQNVEHNLRGREIERLLTVFNDTAEKGVKLIEEFNS